MLTRKMKTLTLLLILSLAGSGLPRSAEPVSLDDACSIALTNHPQMQAARFEIAAAEARLIDAGKLPNPDLEFTARRSQAGGDDREGSAFAGFSQRFPVTDRLRRSREIRQVEIDLAKAEVKNRERLLIAEVQDQFVRVLAARERIAVLKDLEGRTEAYVELARQRLDAAQGSELDVASARTETLLAAQARQQAEAEALESLAALRPLLGMNPDADFPLAGTVATIIDDLEKNVSLRVPESSNRADVTAARIGRDRAGVEKKLADAERWEDWEVSIGYENERTVDEPIGAERDHFFGIGLRIPLPLRIKGEGRIAEAEAEAAKAGKLLDAAEAASLAEIAREIESVRRTGVLADSLANETLPLIEERETKTKQAYARGAVEFTSVIQLQQQQARIRETLLQSRRDHALALVRLQSALGSHPLLKNSESSK